MKKVETDYDYYSLPFEMIYEILSWLPGSDLLRYKCVSKSWYRLINDPKFIKLNVARSLEANSNSSLILESFAKQFRFHNHIFSYQYSRHSNHRHLHDPKVTQLFDPNQGFFDAEAEPLHSTVVGSCHGLVCLRYALRGRKKRYLIYNPTTRDSKILPDHHQLDFVGDYTLILGFGYDSVSDDYKLLSTSFLYDYKVVPGTTPQRSMLYSLKADAWETVDNPPWKLSLINFTCVAFVNNSFHWLDYQSREIKCFSLSTRTYYEIPLTESMFCRPEKLAQNVARVTEFKGQLCVVTSYFDIWVLKEYESWNQVFHNDKSLLIVDYYARILPKNLRVACFPDDHNNIILLLTHYCYGVNIVLWLYCDVASETAKEIEMPGFPPELGLAALQPWVESLVPLH